MLHFYFYLKTKVSQHIPGCPRNQKRIHLLLCLGLKVWAWKVTSSSSEWGRVIKLGRNRRPLLFNLGGSPPDQMCLMWSTLVMPTCNPPVSWCVSQHNCAQAMQQLGHCSHLAFYTCNLGVSGSLWCNLPWRASLP